MAEDTVQAILKISACTVFVFFLINHNHFVISLEVNIKNSLNLIIHNSMLNSHDFINIKMIK